jgi:hypothetical protein
MDRVCSTVREKIKAYRILWKCQLERIYEETIDLSGKIILRWILEIQIGSVRIGFIRLRTEISGGLLRTLY